MNPSLTNQTPWGWPDQTVAISNWVSEYGAWLLIGSLIVLALATADSGGTQKSGGSK